MKGKRSKSEFEDELRPEYDFSKMRFVGRGIYAERYRTGTRFFLLEPDTKEVSSENESLNREDVTE
jgi:hypothetical protein